ncbi:MAG: prepilin peptidase [Lachnospiraceae bacterium]|nr:prepilin peptidase [Lachnospiraceae bacterium]
MNWDVDMGRLFIAGMLLSLFGGLLCDMVLRQYLREAKHLHKTAFIGMAVTAVWMAIYGYSMLTLRCALLCHILILAGAADMATNEIPDAFHLLIGIVGLIYFEPIFAFAGFLLVPLPFLIAALKTGKIGGGDVKLMAACGFTLGVSGGIRMIIWGLIMALLWNGAMCREKEKVPLAPFLAFGGFMALLPN